MHLPDRALQVDGVGAAIAAPRDQLVANVADLVAVRFLVAFGTLGGQANGRIGIADVAVGDVIAGFGVHTQAVGAHELVTALERDVAAELRHDAGAGELVALDVGGQVAANGGGGRVGLGGIVERGQHVGSWTQVPVHWLLIGQGRQANGNAQGQGKQA